MKDFIRILAVVCLLLPVTVFSQMEPQRVHWEFETVKIGENEFVLQFKATPDKHWHLYGTRDELYPLYIEYGDSSLFQTTDSMISFPKAELKYDELMFANREQFDGKAIFFQKIKLLSGDKVNLKGFADYQTCIEIEDGRCLMEKQDFDFSIDPASTREVNYDELIEETEKAYILQHADNEDTVEADTVNPEVSSSSDDSNDIKNKSLFNIFLIAFGAGLLAIFTPCVLPMVPMTVTFFMKSSENKAKGRKQAFMYGFSILFIFTIIGSLLSFVFGPQFFQWISTHWIPNIFFFLIFMVFAAAFFGMFEIRVPNWLISKSDQQADKGGLLGPFFMAFTLVLVSFSCTVPIIGAVVVMLSEGNFLHPIVAMFGFGLAFALPFTLFAMFPRWLNSLPKSGGWMNTIKVVLGFIEVALGLKFLSVADMTYHWGLLDREVYLAFWIVIFFLMGIYLLGKIKFPHDSDLPTIKFPRLMLAVVTFSFVVYLIPGLFGAPLKALSGWIPPMATHDFNIPGMIREASFSSGADGATRVDIYSEYGSPKYKEVIHSPHGIQGYYDYEQGLKVAKEMNRPVFIDFSGHGCVNCRKMEEEVWSAPGVLKRLINDYVVIQLYTDDRTVLPEEEWTSADISYDGNIKKTIGEKWSEVQVRRFKRNSQPQYVLLDFNGDKLIDETRGAKYSIDDYINFLDTGVEAFKEKFGDKKE